MHFPHLPPNNSPPPPQFPLNYKNALNEIGSKWPLLLLNAPNPSVCDDRSDHFYRANFPFSNHFFVNQFPLQFEWSITFSFLQKKILCVFCPLINGLYREIWPKFLCKIANLCGWGRSRGYLLSTKDHGRIAGGRGQCVRAGGPGRRHMGVLGRAHTREPLGNVRRPEVGAGQGRAGWGTGWPW